MEIKTPQNLKEFCNNEPSYKAIVNNFRTHHQEHVFNQVDNLSTDQLKAFLDSIKDLDLDLVDALFNDFVKNPQVAEKAGEEIEEMKHILSHAKMTESSKKEMRDTGIKLIKEGKVAVLLMSGGQGSRLGFEHAKGLYDIGMPSKKTIFEYHAYKIRRISEMICELDNKPYTKSLVKWYLMTSQMNHHEIEDYFKKNNYFGLGEDMVAFFQQESLPALDLDGKIIFEEENQVCLAPNGNGGVFSGLTKFKVISDMKKRGIEYLNIFGVDNVLAKPADPELVGYAVQGKYNLACKYVTKAYPEEKVGVHVLKGGKPYVIEYSEMTPDQIHKKDANGNLYFGISHILNALYHISFLEVASKSSTKQYHLAKKKIKYFDQTKGTTITPTDINGYKFEMFYFDVFSLCDPDQFGLIEVKREEEFAPVKNAPGSAQDSPDTARALMSQLHQKWLEEKGVKFNNKADSTKDTLFEIDVKKVYDGNDHNLEKLAQKYKGSTIELPLYVEL